MQKIKWKTEKRKISDLKSFEGNPRMATEKDIEDLDKSLERFDVAEPLVINSDGTVIGGNFRLSRLKEKGVKEVDVRVPDRKLNQKEAEELNLRLNKNQGRWNFDVLANFGEDLLKDVGFSDDEMDQVFGLETADEFNEQEEFDKAVKNPRGVKAGDLWQLGDHKLIIGDSTNRENWQRLLGDEKFDFMFTDPPYRLAYCKKRVRKVHTKEGWKVKKEREYDSVGETDREGKVKINPGMEPAYRKIKMWAVKKGIAKPTPQFAFGSKLNREYDGVAIKGGVPEFDEWLSIAKDFQNPIGSNVMIFESWKNTRELWTAVEKYWKVMNMIIWHTPNRMQGFTSHHKFYSKYDIAILAEQGKSPLNEEWESEVEEYLKEKGQKVLDSYDIIIYGSSEKGSRDLNISKAKRVKWGKVTDHIAFNVGSESNTNQNLVFGTKPIPILLPYLKVLSYRNGIVMEPYGGSGSTIIASHIMKRKCRAIEISPTYGEVILSRFEKFTGIKPIKVDK